MSTYTKKITSLRKRRAVEQLGELPDSYLDCRDMMHSWTRDGHNLILATNGKNQMIRRKLVCSRCGTERYDTYAVSTMDRVSVTYRHAPGYLLHPGGALNARPLARREAFTRMGVLPHGG